MKKIMLATAAAAALLTGAATWQPAEAQVRYVTRHHHGYYGGGWGWNNPVAFGAGAIVGTAAALATAPLWAATGGYGYGYDYGYAPAYYYRRLRIRLRLRPADLCAGPRGLSHAHRAPPGRVSHARRGSPPHRPPLASFAPTTG